MDRRPIFARRFAEAILEDAANIQDEDEDSEFYLLQHRTDEGYLFRVSLHSRH